MRKAAVIGLGFAGFRFDLDPLRKEIWSHSGAYKAAEGIHFAAAVESDASKHEDFKKYYPDIPLYFDVDELLSEEAIDIVSVCVPTQYHLDIVKELVGNVKAIFCEKPLAYDYEDAKKIVTICKEAGTLLMVNYIRRWETNFIHAKQIIDAGQIGEIRVITGHYPGEIFNIGTHLFDIMSFFAGPVIQVAGTVGMLEGEREEAGSGMLLYKNGCNGFVVSHGIRKNALFEVDIIGSKGRLILFENGRKIKLSMFEESLNASGYYELHTKDVLIKEKNKKERMIRAVENLMNCLDNKENKPKCSGEDALHTLEIAFALINSHKASRFVDLTDFSG